MKNRHNKSYLSFVSLSSLAQQISWDIEVHDVPLSDWRKGSPHVFEIQRWGIPV